MKYLKRFNENNSFHEIEIYEQLFFIWGLSSNHGIVAVSSSDVSSHNLEMSKDGLDILVNIYSGNIIIINLWGKGEFLYKILRNEYSNNYLLINAVKNSVKNGFNVKVNLGRPVGDVTPRRGANIFKNFIGLSEILKFTENMPNWWTYRSYALPAFLKTAESDDILNWWKHIKNSPDIFKILHFLKTNFRNTRVANEISTDCIGYYERFKLIIGEEEIDAIETGEKMGGLGF